MMPDAVAHTCNTGHSVDGEWEDHQPGKMAARPPSQQNKPGIVVRTCDSSSEGSIDRRIIVQDHPGQKAIPYLKHNLKAKMEVWRHG
jgi:hypothetical protein